MGHGHPVTVKVQFDVVVVSGHGSTVDRANARRPDFVTLVECGDTGSPDDVDIPDDLATIRSRLTAPETAP